MIITANWKMNLGSAQASDLIATLNAKASKWSGINVILCPATPYLHAARGLAHEDFFIGGQACHSHASGAFTGDVSAAMIKDCGATHVIVGHSERRQHRGERGEILAQQARQALAAGLEVIFCVGEDLPDRQKGNEKTVVAEQLAAIADELKTGQISILSYEPIWAIGTGQVASVDDIEAMHRFIKAECAAMAGEQKPLSILYGGSVKPDNADAILSTFAVDGALVGGASLDAASFEAICDAGQRVSSS